MKHISLFANGTLTLVTALQPLRVSGEVITRFYSFVATAHSLLWNGIKPVFADIDPYSLNLVPQNRGLHHPQTAATMSVHCFGHPGDMAAIICLNHKTRKRSHHHRRHYERSDAIYMLRR